MSNKSLDKKVENNKTKQTKTNEKTKKHQKSNFICLP